MSGPTTNGRWMRRVPTCTKRSDASTGSSRGHGLRNTSANARHGFRPALSSPAFCFGRSCRARLPGPSPRAGMCRNGWRRGRWVRNRPLLTATSSKMTTHLRKIDWLWDFSAVSRRPLLTTGSVRTGHLSLDRTCGNIGARLRYPTDSVQAVCCKDLPLIRFRERWPSKCWRFEKLCLRVTSA